MSGINNYYPSREVEKYNNNGMVRGSQDDRSEELRKKKIEKMDTWSPQDYQDHQQVDTTYGTATVILGMLDYKLHTYSCSPLPPLGRSDHNLVLRTLQVQTGDLKPSSREMEGYGRQL